MAENIQNDEALKAFDPTKPLIINAAEIKGFENFVGRFVFRRSTIQDKLQMQIRATKLKENTELNTLGENLAYILACFSVVCTEKPVNFEFEGLFDIEPLFELYQRYESWLEFFRLKFQEGKKETS
jgi:hypothetical protein